MLPTSHRSQDPSVADLVRPRFGSEVYDRLVEPLLGGVHAGDPARLSAKSTVPEIKAMAEAHRSLYLTMRSRRAQAPNQRVRRWFPSQGHGGSGGRSCQEISPQAVLAGTEVSGVERTGAGWCISTAGGRISAEELVLAVPAYAAADLLEPLAPELSSELRGIPYVDVANATLAFRAHDLPELPPGTGFLVPPVEDRFIVGCTWLTNKWPRLVNDDVVLIKSMVGRAGDRRWLTMSDEQLIEAVRADLSGMLGNRRATLRDVRAALAQGHTPVRHRPCGSAGDDRSPGRRHRSPAPHWSRVSRLGPNRLRDSGGRSCRPHHARVNRTRLCTAGRTRSLCMSH